MRYIVRVEVPESNDVYEREVPRSFFMKVLDELVIDRKSFSLDNKPLVARCNGTVNIYYTDYDYTRLGGRYSARLTVDAKRRLAVLNVRVLETKYDDKVSAYTLFKRLMPEKFIEYRLVEMFRNVLSGLSKAEYDIFELEEFPFKNNYDIVRLVKLAIRDVLTDLSILGREPQGKYDLEEIEVLYDRWYWCEE